jgi:uncharacterized protein YeeX (DUF496 family)
VGAITVTISASDISDISSAVVAGLTINSTVSDIYSLLSDLQSDFQSRVPKRVATDSQLSDLASDVKSAVAGITASVGASDISDIASAVWANTIGTRVDSRILVAQSFLSDIRSNVSDLQSDFQSRVPKAVATNSQLSDLHSDLRSYLGVMSDVLSDLQSDFQSRVPKRVATDSQLSDLASDLKSAVAAAPVNALNVDTYAEPAQGTPGATVTLATKIGFLYKAWRNKVTQTSTQYSLLNDDGVTVDHKAAVADDGVTFSKNEIATGP